MGPNTGLTILLCLAVKVVRVEIEPVQPPGLMMPEERLEVQMPQYVLAT